MPLDKREREEIRAVVASELQDVLRQEMAQWWAESALALSAARPRPPSRAEAPDAEYLMQLAQTLARSQEMLALDLQRAMGRLRSALDEMAVLADGLDAPAGPTTPPSPAGALGPRVGSGQE